MPRYFKTPSIASTASSTTTLLHRRRARLTRRGPEGALVYSNTVARPRSSASSSREADAGAGAEVLPRYARRTTGQLVVEDTDAALAALTDMDVRRIMAARGVGPPDEPPATPAACPAPPVDRSLAIRRARAAEAAAGPAVADAAAGASRKRSRASLQWAWTAGNSPT